jgi:AraC-like DNA-binding protein
VGSKPAGLAPASSRGGGDDARGPLNDCALRLIPLLGTPQAIPSLYPLMMRELCSWLLSGPHGVEIVRLTLASSHAGWVVSALHHPREHVAERVQVEALAGLARRSVSAFHRQFKALTAMTPRDCQKHLRLLEARRLMVAGNLNAERAALAVGDEPLAVQMRVRPAVRPPTAPRRGRTEGTGS